MDPLQTSEDASAIAVHKAKNAQQAIEMARQLQIQEAVAKTAEETRRAVFEGLHQIFGEPDGKDPEQMRVIHQKIPILCIRMDAIDNNIKNIQDNLTWTVRLIIGAVLLAILKLIFIP